MPIELWKRRKEIFNGKRFNDGLRYFPLFSFIWCNPQHYEGLKSSQYTRTINKNQIYIIMQNDQVTKRVKEIAKLIGINLLDHLIITDETYYSYSENGRI